MIYVVWEFFLFDHGWDIEFDRELDRYRDNMPFRVEVVSVFYFV